MIVTLGLVLYEEDYRWKSPINYLMMALITLSFGVAIAGWTSRFSYETTCITFGVLLMTMLFIFVGALFTTHEKDLMENLGKAAIAASLVQFLYVYITLRMVEGSTNPNFGPAVYASCGSALFGFYLLADMLWVMDPGNTDYGDFILGSMLIYVDFIRIAIYLILVMARHHSSGDSLFGDILNV